ncbi:g1464 [Coccomyxa viridis]|uniref:tRNA-5-taurinomethyluridine 2-sulfurtransferase n=1 Tax=Coccomyxa viridis TaxID=1274662 RepID=A0ABP1FLV8_9CHLO
MGARISRQQLRRKGTLARPGLPRSTVAVGISGGVDSAVAAMLLKERGHDVFGVFMRNWDESEEKGNENCSVEADLAQAKSVCHHIGIPLHEVNFVRQYWTQVFSDFLAQCEAGVTPNPDLACNRHIKFGALLDHCKGLGADKVATGHYAQIARCSQSGQLQLLRGLDPLKDQSYFLASVHGQSLADVVFPLGRMRKEQVRSLAQERGIPSALRQSSAGICFIGRREFGDFISDYTAPVAGHYVDVDTGSVLGPCANMLALTLGQGSRISGLSTRMYVAGKDMQQRIVYVAAGPDHPALYTHTAALQEAHWIAGEAPEQMRSTGSMECSFKARYRQVPELCSVSMPGRASGCTPSAFTRLESNWSAPGASVAFAAPARAITPQQAFVMYSGEEALDCDELVYAVGGS